jgi:peptidoglycan/xylan/chitin deacetylase (PgdA/CDA1 family)
MRIPGRTLLRQGWRQWRARGTPHALILGYHRVTNAPDDPFDLSVTLAAMDAQLALLKRQARVIPLPQVIEELASKTLSPRTVALTFDDGYDDTITAVLPLLERHALPATIFVTTGNLGAPYWWDALAAAVLQPRTLPPRLTVGAPLDASTWETDNRHALLARLADALRPLEASRRDQLVRDVVAWSGVALPQSPRALTASEIATLAAHPLVTVGAHSVTHPPLAGRSRAEQDREVRECVATLVAAGAPAPRVFSYPHGSFNATTQDVLRDAGFAAACCSEPDVATAHSAPLALPRLWVDRTQRGAFDRWLEGWL